MFLPWYTGLNMLQSDCFMSNAYAFSELGYSTEEFRALQMIDIVVSGALDYPPAS